MDSGGLRSARNIYGHCIYSPYHCVLIHNHALFSDDYWMTFVSKWMYGVHNSQVPVTFVST